MNIYLKEVYFRVFIQYYVHDTHEIDDGSEKREKRKESPCDRLASLEIQLLDLVSEQEESLDNAQRTTRAMPPRESWSGKRDENNSGRILRHFAMRRDRWKEEAKERRGRG